MATGGGGGVRVAAGGSSYTGACTGAVSTIDAPQEPQNFISGGMTAPQDGQLLVTGSSEGAGIEGPGAGGCPASPEASSSFAPQFPQNISPGAMGLLHIRQNSCSGGFGNGGAGLATGCAGSACDAPQCRQNFAVGATL